jgi:hypothetical protein
MGPDQTLVVREYIWVQGASALALSLVRPLVLRVGVPRFASRYLVGFVITRAEGAALVTKAQTESGVEAATAAAATIGIGVGPDDFRVIVHLVLGPALAWV